VWDSTRKAFLRDSIEDIGMSNLLSELGDVCNRQKRAHPVKYGWKNSNRYWKEMERDIRILSSRR
jgi:hypothetical protein